MSPGSKAAEIAIALAGALGVFLVGFFGSELLFAPASEGVALEATLLPSIAAAVAGFLYFLQVA
jgi:hypothetical protein